jgi:hypothetical protein
MARDPVCGEGSRAFYSVRDAVTLEGRYTYSLSGIIRPKTGSLSGSHTVGTRRSTLKSTSSCQSSFKRATVSVRNASASWKSIEGYPEDVMDTLQCHQHGQIE